MINKRNINWFVIFSLFCMIFLFSITNNQIFDAVLLLILSVVLIIKVKTNKSLMLSMVFIFYSLYSIVIGEYITKGRLGIPVFEVKTEEIYGLLLKVMVVFIGIITFFIPQKNNNIRAPKPLNNKYIFYCLSIIILIIGIFGINRGDSLSSYTVSVSPMYEYSIILFVFAYYYSGERLIRKYILIIMAIFFIFQDFYYGGRITSLQIVLMLVMLYYDKVLSTLNVVIFVFLGIVLNNLVGSYRSTYSLNELSIVNILFDMKEKLLVFDTPVYAYYSSATHLAAVKYGNIMENERIQSLLYFFKSIFIGGGNDSGNVTKYVSSNYFYNIGGGLMPSHFYFWMGWTGVVIAAILIVIIYYICSKNDRDITKVVSVVVISFTPRWFLYNPLLLFRSIFISIVLFGGFSFFHKLTLKREKTNIKI